MKAHFLLRSSLPAAFAGSLLTGAMAGAQEPLDFVHQVAPVLKEHCGSCHTGDKRKGGFSMNTHAAFLEGGENGKVYDPQAPAKSRMLEVIFSDDPDEVMPPPEKDRKRPTPEQLALLKRWLHEGAVWETGFAFQKPSYQAPVKPRLPELPPLEKGWENPVDRLLKSHYAKHGVEPPEQTDDATFARRTSLDLVGLLPEVADLQRFLEDKSPDKRSRWIDALLERNMDYAEHWLTFWNDLLRNDYGGTGFITGGRKQVSEWLYDSLASNKPYDQMVRELVNPNSQADGFAQGITWRGTVSASQTREVQYSQSISQAFLGLNMKCASCHDSFVDHWKLTDAYGLAAVYSDKPIEIARCEKLTGKTATPAWLFPEIGRIDPDAPKAARMQQLAALMTSRDNGWFARTIVNRLWAQLLGRGIVHPVDAMGTQPWNEDLLDYLGWHLAENGYDLKKTLQLITNSNAYEARAVMRVKGDTSAPFVFRGPQAKRLTAEAFEDAIWTITQTAPTTPDAPVRRGQPDPSLSASKELSASWLAAPQPAEPKTPEEKNPIQIWRKKITLPSAPTKVRGVVAGVGNLQVYLNNNILNSPHVIMRGPVGEIRGESEFKKGEQTLTVASPNGAKPGEPGLWLQMEFHFTDGSRTTVVTDDSWQTAGAFSGQHNKKDGLGPVTIAAEPAKPAFSQENLRREMAWVTQPQPPVRASLMKADNLMRSLGRPNRDQIVTSRPQDLSTLEALDISAGAQLAELLRQGAPKLLTQHQKPEELVTHVYARTLARKPSPEEKTAALEALGSAPTPPAVEDFLWAMLALPEFQLIR